MRNHRRAILLVVLTFALLLAPVGDLLAKPAYCDEAFIGCLDGCDAYFGWHPILQVSCYSGCSFGYNDCGS